MFNAVMKRLQNLPAIWNLKVDSAAKNFWYPYIHTSLQKLMGNMKKLHGFLNYLFHELFEVFCQMCYSLLILTSGSQLKSYFSSQFYFEQYDLQVQLLRKNHVWACSNFGEKVWSACLTVCLFLCCLLTFLSLGMMLAYNSPSPTSFS